MMINRIATALVTITIVAALAAAGCEDATLEANKRQVEANQQLIEETQREIARLHAQQGPPPPAPAPGTPGTCDKKVMNTASRRAGDAYAAGDLNRALGYYQDALTACPDDAKAKINVARTYEGLGNRTEAIRYYRAVASSANADSDSSQSARVALSRLGVTN